MSQNNYQRHVKTAYGTLQSFQFSNCTNWILPCEADRQIDISNGWGHHRMALVATTLTLTGNRVAWLEIKYCTPIYTPVSTGS